MELTKTMTQEYMLSNGYLIKAAYDYVLTYYTKLF